MRFRFSATLLLLIFGIATGLSLISFSNWPLVLINQFTLYFVAIQTVMIVATLLLFTATSRFHWKYILCLTVLIALTLFSSRDFFYYLPTNKPSPYSNNQVRLLHLNVLGTNRHIKKAATIISNTQPDILTLVEYNPTWQKELRATRVLNAYPYTYTVRFGNDGIYSKLPLTHCQTQWISQRNNRITTCDVQIHGTQTTLVLTSVANEG